ncbi:MAG: hypothetical protein WDZ41_00800 [Candidatus Babeliales bacterium]
MKSIKKNLIIFTIFFSVFNISNLVSSQKPTRFMRTNGTQYSPGPIIEKVSTNGEQNLIEHATMIKGNLEDGNIEGALATLSEHKVTTGNAKLNKTYDNIKKRIGIVLQGGTLTEKQISDLHKDFTILADAHPAFEEIHNLTNAAIFKKAHELHKKGLAMLKTGNNKAAMEVLNQTNSWLKLLSPYFDKLGESELTVQKIIELKE